MRARTVLTTALWLALAAPMRAQEAPVVDVFTPLDARPELQGLDLLYVDDAGPVALAVQAPLVPSEGHAGRVAQLLGDFAQALVDLFGGDYLTPAGLAPREGRETLLIVVLSDGKLFAKLRDGLGVHDARDDRAFFAPALPAVVVLDVGPVEGQPGTLELVRPMSHAAVHALLDACLPPDRALPLWLVEGLAERLAANNGRLPAKRESLRTFDADSLLALAAPDDVVWQASAARRLDELLAVTSSADLAGPETAPAATQRETLRALGGSASLFMGWLDEGTLGYLSPEQRDQVWSGRRLAQAVLAGQPCAEAVGEILGAGAPASLQAAFDAWLAERSAERRGAAPMLAASAPEAVPAEPGAPAPPVGAARLAVPVGDPDLDRARALQRASEGELLAAVAALDALLARPELPPELAAAARDERRVLHQLADLRRRWVGEHAGKAVDLRDGGTTVRATLTGLQGDALAIRHGGATRELPLDALRPGTLAGLLLAPDTVLSPADEEARALAWLLATDAGWQDRTWSRVRKESGTEAQALLARREELAAGLQLGRAVAGLDVLAAAAVPLAASAPPERDAWLARATAVLEARELPVVAERVAALRTLLREVLGAVFDAAPLEYLELHGKVEALPGGRVRASWDFSDAEQLLDWSSVTLREADLGLLRPLKNPLPGPPGLAIEGRQLVVRGRGHWRCALPLTAPLALSCQLDYRRTPAELDGAVEELQEALLLRVCADRFGSYLQCEGLGRLTLLDKLAAASSWADPVVAGRLAETWYDVRLEHDGQKLRALVDGSPVSTVPIARRTQGFVELLHNTERPIMVRLLEVEGTIDLPSLAPVRDAWVAQQLVERGAWP
jgi:hypothetical protein